MSAISKQRPVLAEADTITVASVRPGSRVGPSRRLRRAHRKLGNAVALCAMAAWAVVGLMPVVAVLYAIYGY